MNIRWRWSDWLQPRAAACLLCGRTARSGSPAAGGLAPRFSRPGPRQALETLCPSCRSAIPWIGTIRCEVCGRPEACPDCPRRAVRHAAYSRCGVRYDGAMKELLARYKYQGSERLEAVMAAMLAGAFERLQADLRRKGIDPAFHYVASVPLSRERLCERGFNQAERMGAALARWYGLPFGMPLRRVRDTGRQSRKSRGSRLADLAGAFAADVSTVLPFVSSEQDAPSRILLVDDVYTTGSTVNECAKTLIEALGAVRGQPPGKVEVHAVLWARS